MAPDVRSPRATRWNPRDGPPGQRDGGQSIDAETTDPHTYFRQIAEELRTSYELGYYPTNPAKDETFRKM